MLLMSNDNKKRINTTLAGRSLGETQKWQLEAELLLWVFIFFDLTSPSLTSCWLSVLTLVTSTGEKEMMRYLVKEGEGCNVLT